MADHNATSRASASESPNERKAAYRAVLFKRLPPAAEFECSAEVALPGTAATPAAAWGRVFAALRAGDADLIGGTVREAA